MDTIKLRTLTRKSILGFGKDANLTIQEIINLNRFQYIRWVYFTYAGISFMDDILKEVGVYGDNYDYRISKPSCDVSKIQILNSIKQGCVIKNYGIKSYMMNKNRTRNTFKRNYAAIVAREKISFSKGVLQSKNHGF